MKPGYDLARRFAGRCQVEANIDGISNLVLACADKLIITADSAVAQRRVDGRAVERVVERQAVKFQCDQRFRCDPPCHLCRSWHECQGPGLS